jgi:hypothetical protein
VARQCPPPKGHGISTSSRGRVENPAAVRTDGPSKTFCTRGTTPIGTERTAASPAVVDRKNSRPAALPGAAHHEAEPTRAHGTPFGGNLDELSSVEDVEQFGIHTDREDGQGQCGGDDEEFGGEQSQAAGDGAAISSQGGVVAEFMLP